MDRCHFTEKRTDRFNNDVIKKNIKTKRWVMKTDVFLTRKPCNSFVLSIVSVVEG